MPYQHIKVPEGGDKITVNKDFSLNVSDQPIIPYIEGDGTGFDITPVMIKVVDAAVAHAYKGKRKIHWMEIFAGEKATKVYGPDVAPGRNAAGAEGIRGVDQGAAHDPGRRRDPFAERRAAPGTRPVRVPAPGAVLQGRAVSGARAAKIDMVIFRENSEDIYAGIEWAAAEQAKKVIKFLQDEMGVKKIRFPETSGIGVKPVSTEGTERLVRKAISMRSTTIASRSRWCTRATS